MKQTYKHTMIWANGYSISTIHPYKILAYQARWWKQVCEEICGKDTNGNKFVSSVLEVI